MKDFIELLKTILVEKKETTVGYRLFYLLLMLIISVTSVICISRLTQHSYTLYNELNDSKYMIELLEYRDSLLHNYIDEISDKYINDVNTYIGLLEENNLQDEIIKIHK